MTLYRHSGSILRTPGGALAGSASCCCGGGSICCADVFGGGGFTVALAGTGDGGCTDIDGEYFVEPGCSCGPIGGYICCYSYSAGPGGIVVSVCVSPIEIKVTANSGNLGEVPNIWFKTISDATSCDGAVNTINASCNGTATATIG